MCAEGGVVVVYGGVVDAVGVDESSFPGLSGEQKIIATFLSDLLPCVLLPC